MRESPALNSAERWMCATRIFSSASEKAKRLRTLLMNLSTDPSGAEFRRELPDLLSLVGIYGAETGLSD